MESNLRLEFIAAILVLCIVSGAASAQQSMPGRGSAEGSDLIRPCNALAATSDCAIGLPTTPNRTLDGERSLREGSMGRGMSSEHDPAAGPLGRTGDGLSRGISGGRVGIGGAEGPLGGGGSGLGGGLR
jgi:hypothetical protein